MRSLLRMRCVRVVLCTTTLTILCLLNATIAGPPQWMSSIFKSKKAVQKQPSMVNVPNFSRSSDAVVNQASAAVVASAQAAARDLERVASNGVVRPAQQAVPMAVRNQTTDQYLAGLLQKAQATPQSKGQFAQKFPELRSDFARKKTQQPELSDTDAKGLASWLANGTAAPNIAGSPASKTQPAAGAAAATGAVQVAHTGEVNGQSLADWANVPASNSPAASAVADAIAPAGDIAEPIVPEQYRNMKIPGLPEDARIMSVQDRVVTPATIPGATASTSPTIEALTFPPTNGVSNTTPQTVYDSVPQIGTTHPQMMVNGVPAAIDNMVPQMIDTTMQPPHAAMGVVTSQPMNMATSQPIMVSGAPSAAMGHTEMSPPMQSMAAPQMNMQQMATPRMAMQPMQQMQMQQMTQHNVIQSPTSMQPVQSQVTMQPHVMSQPQVQMQPHVMSQPHVTMQPHAMSQPQVQMHYPAAQAQPVSPGQTWPPESPSLKIVGRNQPTSVAPRTPAQLAPTNPKYPSDRPVHLTMEQIRNLPVGTKLIPANDAAVAALKNQQRPAPQVATKPQAGFADSPQRVTTIPSRTSIVSQVPAARQPVTTSNQKSTSVLATIRNGLGISKPTTIFGGKPKAVLAENEQVVLDETIISITPTVAPATEAQQVAATSDAAATVAPATPQAPTGPTQSMLVKDRLNRAFALGATNPAMAETEFVDILRYVSKAHDAAEGLDTYAPALERGLMTLREAEQIQEAITNKGEGAAIMLANSLPGGVSQSYAAGKITTDEVMGSYHLYARHSLMIAIGEQPLGSQALYGLGQIYSSRRNNGFDQEKAQTVLTASLDADKNNWRAHNEMGIIHARKGSYADAEKAFRRSLAINPRTETYNNIAKVVDRQSNPGMEMNRPSPATEFPSMKSSPMVAESVTPPAPKPKSGSAQVGAEEPLSENLKQRDKVRAFVDRIMGNDQKPKSYQDDDGIPISQ